MRARKLRSKQQLLMEQSLTARLHNPKLSLLFPSSSTTLGLLSAGLLSSATTGAEPALFVFTTSDTRIISNVKHLQTLLH